MDGIPNRVRGNRGRPALSSSPTYTLDTLNEANQIAQDNEPSASPFPQPDLPAGYRIVDADTGQVVQPWRAASV